MGEVRQDIHVALGDLHEALEAASDLDAADRAELASAIEEIRDALGDSAAGRERGTLDGGLRAAITRFEGQHPKLTEVIGRVADALSEMGI